MSDVTKVPQRRLDARVRKVKGQVLVAGPAQALSLSDVAADVWRLVDGERDVNAIVNLLLEEYEVPRDVLERDVLALLDDLVVNDVLAWAR